MPPRKAITRRSSKPSVTPHKRSVSETSIAGTPGSRKSSRLSASAGKSAATPRQSQYFEGSDDSESDPSETADDAEESGYDDDDENGDASSTGESPDDSDSDADTGHRQKSQKRQSGRGTTAGKTGPQMAKDLWRPGVKTGLGPGKQVFIEKPKPRGDGGIKYAPDKIHPNTMAFLRDLKANNDREWLKMHDPDYRQSWKDWESFVEALTEKIAEIDETIPELPPKDLVFRIYRDIRFSSDPTPYKPHFSAAWSRTGRKGPYACYYVQIQPGGKSLVGAGLWMPEAQPLALIRAHIDRKPGKLKRILLDARMRKSIFGGVAHDEKKAVRAFATQNAEHALKTKPKGYEADHPNIELLRLRNFTLGKRLPDEIITAHGMDAILELIGILVPFVTYLNSVVMPDADESSSDDEPA